MPAGEGVRCPACGAVGPADARWCPSCGAALTDELLVIEPAGGPAPARPPATRVRSGGGRRGKAAAVLAGAGALVAVVVAAPWSGEEAAPPTTSTTTSRARSPSTTAPRVTTTTAPPGPEHLAERTGGVRLVLTRNGAVHVLDVDAAELTSYAVAPLRSDGTLSDPVNPVQPPRMARVGERLVFQAGAATWTAPLDFSAEPTSLGPSLLFLVSAAPGRVWLVDVPGGGRPTVREEDLAGRTTTLPVPVPTDWTPVGAVEGALVLSRGDRFQVWEPATGRVRMTSEPGATLVASGGRLVAWRFYCEEPFCPLHVTDVAGGGDRVVRLAPAFVGPSGAAFSPDGRTLATFAARPQDGAAPARALFEGGPPRTALAFVDLASGAVEYVTAPANEQQGPPVWSASGAWVFSATSPAVVQAYRRGVPAPLALDLGRGYDGPLVAW